jgi:hypothetical protein
MLLYSLALFAFYFGLERDRPGYLLLSVLLLYLAASERLFALFMVPVVVCYLILLKVAPFEKPPGLRTRNLVLIALPALAFGIYELYNFATSGYSIIAYALDFFVGQVNHSPLRLLGSMIYRIGIPLVCLGSLGGVYLLVRKRREGLLVCLAAWLPPLALLLLAPFAFTVDRYIFVTLPFWAILGAVALTELFVRADKYGRILSLGVLLLFVADSLSQDASYYLYQNGNRPDWKGAFSLIAQEMAEEDLVLATSPELGHQYLGDGVEWINSMDPDAIERAGRRVWFVIDDSIGWVAPDLELWIRENSRLVEVLEVMMPGKSLSISIYLYSPVHCP